MSRTDNRATALRRLAGPAVRLPQGGVARLVRRETGPDGTLPLPHNGQPPSFRQDGPHRVVLITCAGRWLGPASGYESNHIVIAHPF